MTTATRSPLPRDFRLEIVHRKLAKRKRRQHAIARTKNARAVLLVNQSGSQLIVHPSTYREYCGQWQLTTLGPDGTPWGHTNAPTFLEAILRAVGASDDYYWNEHGFEITDVT